MYVSLEIARLLKKAGFKDSVSKCYDGSDCLCSYSTDMKNYNIGGGKNTSAPTYQQTIDWLFENHKIWLSVRISDHGFYADINKLVNRRAQSISVQSFFEDQYQALDAGLKSALNKIC